MNTATKQYNTLSNKELSLRKYMKEIHISEETIPLLEDFTDFLMHLTEEERKETEKKLKNILNTPDFNVADFDTFKNNQQK